MKLLVTGAGGLIGSALVPELRQAGHDVTRACRAGAGPEDARWEPATGRLDSPIAPEGVIHLGGASLAESRWTKALKRRAWASRVETTRALCEALTRRDPPPGVLVAASAIGFYGDRGDEILDESSRRGSGFLAELAGAWEGACEPAARAGVRVAHVRIGVVLARGGGALPRLLPLFRLGLGGPLGNGRQYWSWISLEDVAGVFRRALEDSGFRGPVNAVAPQSVTQREFARTLGRVLRRPALLPAPAFALRVLLGEMADAMLLGSARVRPVRLLEAGHAFRQPLLEDALRAELSRG